MNLYHPIDTIPQRNYIGRANASQMPNYDRICSGAYIYICCVNDLTDSAVRDAIALLRQSRFYRQRIKKAANDTLRAYDRYQAILFQKLHNRTQFWLDLADAYQEAMNRHVLMLRLAINQFLLRRGTPSDDIPLMTAVMVAGTMLAIATQNHELYFQAMTERYGMDVSDCFRAADMRPVQRLFGEVSDAVLPDDADLMPAYSQDKQSMLAIKCLETQMLSHDLINNAGLVALRNNPELVPEGVDVDNLAVIDGVITDPTKN